MSLSDSTEIKKVFNYLFSTLLNESERGAIIIGTTKVEEQLEKYIRKILPSNGEKYVKKLLVYPGALSSFSSKIELAYAFRLIGEKTYASLNVLRKIRNIAAHSPDSFSIHEIREEFEKIFDLGPSLPIIVKNQAMKMMMELKIENVNRTFDEYYLTDEEKKKLWKGLMEDKDLLGDIEAQIPLWELIYGLSLICSIIKLEEEQSVELLGNSKTWSSIMRKTRD